LDGVDGRMDIINLKTLIPLLVVVQF